MSIEPLTVEEDWSLRQIALYEQCRGPAPGRYRAIAEWWRIEAERSADPSTCLMYAENQDSLAADIEARPEHYVSKPIEKTDFEWSTT